MNNAGFMGMKICYPVNYTLDLALVLVNMTGDKPQPHDSQKYITPSLVVVLEEINSVPVFHVGRNDGHLVLFATDDSKDLQYVFVMHLSVSDDFTPDGLVAKC